MAKLKVIKFNSNMNLNKISEGKVTFISSYHLFMNVVTNLWKRKSNSLTMSQIVHRLFTHPHFSCVYNYEHALVYV